MRKKRILWVNEASWKNTGYSIYGREVLARLNKVEEFEVAELATYSDQKGLSENPREWKCYPNMPEKDSESYGTYLSSASSIFGDWSFNHVCLDFKPDIVMDIRDWWMLEYQQRSAFRDFYHWSIMPTVDAEPQDTQWINTFASADSVMAYSEFGRDTMLKQCDKINFIDVASPAASSAFTPASNKRQHKESMGLDSDALIVGTVMRNQRRKLYPDLFQSFRKYLDRTKRSDVFLYCHTYYPDIGWEIPRLLDKFKLNNRVLFSYRCKECGDVSVGFYQGVASYCKKCNSFNRHLVGIENPIDEHELNKIYNLFDIYVQYANSEGFGMPQLEAAYAGVPVISTNYSAMESVIKNIGGVGIDPLALSMECETGCYRAVPDNNTFVDILEIFVNNKNNLELYGKMQSAAARKHYDWDKTAQTWIDHFRTVPMKDWSETWLSPPKIKTPATSMPSEINDTIDQVNYIFNQVLHKPEWIGNYLWSKTIKDVTFGYRVQNLDHDVYFNESHMPDVDRYQKFQLAEAAIEFSNLRDMWNNWEMQRLQMVESLK